MFSETSPAFGHELFHGCTPPIMRNRCRKPFIPHSERSARGAPEMGGFLRAFAALALAHSAFQDDCEEIKARDAEMRKIPISGAPSVENAFGIKRAQRGRNCMLDQIDAQRNGYQVVKQPLAFEHLWRTARIGAVLQVIEQ
eukprot:IDg22543t1